MNFIKILDAYDKKMQHTLSRHRVATVSVYKINISPKIKIVVPTGLDEGLKLKKC